MIHEFHLPRPLKSPTLRKMCWQLLYHLAVVLLFWLLCSYCGMRICSIHLDWWNHESRCVRWGILWQSMPISEKPPPWTSHISHIRCMSETFLSRTSFFGVQLRFPPTRWNTPSGRSWGIDPRRGTYQQADSFPARFCSSRSMSELESAFAESSSVDVLPACFCL